MIVEVRNLGHLNRLISKIKRSKGVVDVLRTNGSIDAGLGASNAVSSA
jgi:hypothetical protein